MTVYREPGHPLVRALTAYRWADASTLTREALVAEQFSPRAVLELDDVWCLHTSQRFGFSVQASLMPEPPPSEANYRAAWSYARAVGALVGWVGQWHWLPLGGTRNAETTDFLKAVPREGHPMTLPRGAFPFYDVVVETPETGYSPRDAYGEGYWSSWRDIWEVVQPNKFDIVPSRPDSDIELLQRLARRVYTEGRDWLHRAALMRELVRQKELETASKEDLEELKTSLDSWDPRVTSLDLDLRLRVEHWLATNSGAG